MLNPDHSPLSTDKDTEKILSPEEEAQVKIEEITKEFSRQFHELTSSSESGINYPRFLINTTVGESLLEEECRVVAQANEQAYDELGPIEQLKYIQQIAANLGQLNSFEKFIGHRGTSAPLLDLQLVKRAKREGNAPSTYSEALKGLSKFSEHSGDPTQNPLLETVNLFRLAMGSQGMGTMDTSHVFLGEAAGLAPAEIIERGKILAQQFRDPLTTLEQSFLQTHSQTISLLKVVREFDKNNSLKEISGETVLDGKSWNETTGYASFLKRAESIEAPEDSEKSETLLNKLKEYYESKRSQKVDEIEKALTLIEATTDAESTKNQLEQVKKTIEHLDMTVKELEAEIQDVTLELEQLGPLSFRARGRIKSRLEHDGHYLDEQRQELANKKIEQQTLQNKLRETDGVLLNTKSSLSTTPQDAEQLKIERARLQSL